MPHKRNALIKKSRNYWACCAEHFAKVSQHGKVFGYIAAIVWLVFCLPVAVGISFCVWKYIFRVLEWPAAYHDMAGLVLCVMIVPLSVYMNYLLLPLLGKITHYFGWIGEEELEILKMRRYPRSFYVT
jgi:hypothetical protein